MHPDMEHLLLLDQTDRELAGLRAEVAALPRRVAEIETKLAGVHAEVEKARKSLKDLEIARRKYESDIQGLQQKISKYRDQMLAVKTNQEYKALGNEIQFNEQEIRLLEDRILEGMIELEALEARLKASDAEQKKQQAVVDKEKEEAKKRTQLDEHKIAELTARREEVRKSINPDTLRHYDRVLKLRGSAIAEARDQYCQSCHVMLRPQVFNELMSGLKVLTCDSCYRILYFNPANAPEGSSERKETTVTAAQEVNPAS